MMKAPFLLFIFFVFSSLAADYELKRYKDDPLNTYHYTLSNGLQVFLTENHEKPVFYAEVVIRAGSSSDPKESTGIAHYLEHMLFKGTDRFGTIDYQKEKAHLDKITELYEKHFNSKDPEERKAIMAEISVESQKASQYAIPNEFDRMYQQMGGTGVNAHTSNEETVYKVVVPSNCLKKWCLIESERFRKPVFRLFQTEIEAVYEEKNGSLDSKDSALYETFLSTVYKNHPYGQQTTLGSVEHLKSPSIKRMYDFYNTYYVPNNMAIIISGDINPEEDIKTISRYFSSWKSQKMPLKKQWVEKPFKGEEAVTVNFPGEEQLMLAFRIPPEGHNDEYALKFMDMILDNSQAGLINVNLNQTLKVKRAGSYPMFFNDYANQTFYGMPKKGQTLEEVKDLILAQIEKVKNGEFEEWLLPAILADFEKSQQSGFESNNGRVSTLRDLFIGNKDVDKPGKDLYAFSKVTKEDIVRVANKYFDKDYVVVYRRDKKAKKVKMNKPEFEKVKADPGRASLFGKRVAMLPVQKKKPEFVNFQKDLKKMNVDMGLSLYTVKNPMNSLFTLTLKIPVGEWHDPSLLLLAKLIEEGGTEKDSPEDIKKFFYSHAGSYSFNVERNETSITLKGLDKNLAKTFRKLHELLKNFKVDEKKMQTQVGIMIEERLKNKKEPQFLSYALSYYSKYKETSPFLTQLSAEKLSAVEAKDLSRSLERLLDTEMKVNYVGTKDIRELKSIISPLGKNVKLVPQDKIKLKILDYEKPTVHFLNYDSVQTYIRMEFPGELYSLETEPEYMLFNEYFDGSLGSVVFQEIRETRALAYSAWSRFFPRGEKDLQNIFIASMTTQADKTIDALKVFHDIIYKFKFSEQRFKVAKNALIRQLETSRLSFRSIIGSVQGWEELGLEENDPRKAHLEAIKKLTLKDLKKFVETKIYGNEMVLSIVGDKNRIDFKKLADFGDIKELTFEDIYTK